ncbi:pyridoxine biosynthesis protein [Clathrus columnatus]|uniref:pyridoxal 5'-phosphate synthase (glutamine hydrolyzing) n=1 Tax=Clathrus columnatus TaxID=1419009 RepID=A0AAV5AC81_9AGAM|nr:pyridoxine biosynthesis protein [Clathrus columnatus]
MSPTQSNGASPSTAVNPASTLNAARSQGREGSSNLGTFQVKSGLAQMLKVKYVFLVGGVIMDVVNAEQARIAEEAGACAVMALERVPADIRSEGGVARMSDPQLIKEIVAAVTIPVMAKVRIGHFVEAQILQAIGVDYIDESEVLTPADEQHHINKHNFKVPFVCGARNLGEALRRISEGAAFIRTKGEAGTGNVVEAVRHERAVMSDIRRASAMNDEELYAFAKEIQAPFHLLKETARLKRLPVSGDPAKRARAIVQAVSKFQKHAQVTHYNNPKILAEISENLGPAMVGLTMSVKSGRHEGRFTEQPRLYDVILCNPTPSELLPTPKQQSFESNFYKNGVMFKKKSAEGEAKIALRQFIEQSPQSQYRFDSERGADHSEICRSLEENV